MADDKKYFLRLTADFGRHMPDGELVVKQPSEVTWNSLDYAEAMTLQVLVFKPMLDELTSDSYELGVQKAVAEGNMDSELAQTLLRALGKVASTQKR